MPSIAGSLRSQIPRSTPAPQSTQSRSHAPIPASQSVSALLHPRSGPKPTWTSGSSSIDYLFAPLAALARASAILAADRTTGEGGESVASVASSGTAPRSKGIGMQPGMIVEIASPPGGGKSSLIMSVLMSARMNGEGEVTEDEVVVIGMCCGMAGLGSRDLN